MSPSLDQSSNQRQNQDNAKLRIQLSNDLCSGSMPVEKQNILAWNNPDSTTQMESREEVDQVDKWTNFNALSRKLDLQFTVTYNTCVKRMVQGQHYLYLYLTATNSRVIVHKLTLSALRGAPVLCSQ
jgi:hypothetical protein